MGKRGVLAAAFLAMAVGLAGADGGDDSANPPANTFTVTLDTVGNPPNAGQYKIKAAFGGFKSPWVNKLVVKIYKVTDGPNGEKIETYTNQQFQKSYTNYTDSDTVEFGFVAGKANPPSLPTGNYRARGWITSDLAVPVDAVTVAESAIKSIP